MYKQNFDIDIDIVGACNLRCPSCPQGNIKDYRLPQGFMQAELLKRIVEKAATECKKLKINLYNWAEPLLHPHLPNLIDIIQAEGIPCHLSSNLNILPNADAIMAANPASFRISISGFNQKIYGKTHRGGNIEKVKKHMVALAEAKKRNNASTRIYVFFHRYQHNLKDEPLLREFATDLGFFFHAVWALLFPLEKILAYALEDIGDFPLTEEDYALIDNLALPLGEALAAARKYSKQPCPLREDSISLDFKGNATLCCGIFNASKYTIGNYLDMPLEEIQKIRHNHPMCGTCMPQGAHVYMTYGISEMDELALNHIAPRYDELDDLRYEIALEKRYQRLDKLYHKFFPRIFSARQKALLANSFIGFYRLLHRTRMKVFEKVSDD